MGWGRCWGAQECCGLCAWVNANGLNNTAMEMGPCPGAPRVSRQVSAVRRALVWTGLCWRVKLGGLAALVG